MFPVSPFKIVYIMRFLKFFLVLCILVTGCTYSFKGYTSQRIYAVYVGIFRNTSERAGIETDITRWVSDYFDTDVRIKMVSENNSEYKIETTVAGYRVEPYEYNPDGTVLSYRVVLLNYVTIVETASGRKIREDKLISAWGVFSSSEREDEGLQRAAEDLGMKILQEFLSSVSQ